MKKLQIFQLIVFNMKEIRMDNILFGQVEKIIQGNHGVSKVSTNQNQAFPKQKILSFLISTNQSRALFIRKFLSFLISTNQNLHRF